MVERLMDVATVDKETLLGLGVTGPLLRAAGFACMAWADSFPLLLSSALLAGAGGAAFAGAVGGPRHPLDVAPPLVRRPERVDEQRDERRGQRPSQDGVVVRGVVETAANVSKEWIGYDADISRAATFGHEGEVQWDPSKPDGQPTRYLDVTRALDGRWKIRLGARVGRQADVHVDVALGVEGNVLVDVTPLLRKVADDDFGRPATATRGDGARHQRRRGPTRGSVGGRRVGEGGGAGRRDRAPE